jgi:hypothetical protein
MSGGTRHVVLVVQRAHLEAGAPGEFTKLRVHGRGSSALLAAPRSGQSLA